MKLRLLATAALLTTLGFVAPVQAQNSQPAQPTTPSVPAQVNGDQVLQACSQDRADTLPNPFTDVSPRDWAFKAVLSMYYCGAYRGSVPPERVKPFLQPQPSQPTSSLTPTERNLTTTPIDGQQLSSLQVPSCTTNAHYQLAS